MEVAVASVAVAFLVASLGAVLAFAARVMPSDKDTTLKAVATRAGFQALARDLAAAYAVLEASPARVEFLVPDRDNDGDPEQIAFVWSGVSGDPLRRIINGSGESIEPRVRAFSITYHTLPGQRDADLGLVESDEVLLASYRGASDGNTVMNGLGLGMSFVPSIPADAQSWRVTRARLWLKSEGTADGVGNVYVMPATDALIPTSTALASSTIRENMLTSGGGWFEVVFPTCVARTPGQPVALVIARSSGSDLGAWGSASAVGHGSTMARATRPLFMSWSSSVGQPLLFEAYGRYTAPSRTVQAVTRLHRATITIKSENHVHSMSVWLPSGPTVP